MSELKTQIQDNLKTAMREQNKARVATLRLIMAAFKQKEVDERIELTDAHVLAILDKMVKQRRESIALYQQGHRQDLVDQEQAEIDIIQAFLPQALSEAEIDALISAAIKQTSATSIKDMGAVVNLIKPQTQGRADMAVVSKKVKEQLS